MLLRVATWQIEQVDALEVGHFLLWVEIPDGGEAVYHFLIEKREAFGIAGYENG